jgi:hypothetical protein
VPDPIFWWRQDRAQRDVDRADEHLARQVAWERQLLSEHEARNRRLLDDEERRMSSVFDVDPMDEPDLSVRWPE